LSLRNYTLASRWFPSQRYEETGDSPVSANPRERIEPELESPARRNSMRMAIALKSQLIPTGHRSTGMFCNFNADWRRQPEHQPAEIVAAEISARAVIETAERDASVPRFERCIVAMENRENRS